MPNDPIQLEGRSHRTRRYADHDALPLQQMVLGNRSDAASVGANVGKPSKKSAVARTDLDRNRFSVRFTFLISEFLANPFWSPHPSGYESMRFGKINS